MNPGIVVIDSAGNATGRGMVFALYKAIVAAQAALDPPLDPTKPPSDWDDTKLAWSEEILPYIVKQHQAYAAEATAHGATLATRQVANMLSGTVTLDEVNDGDLLCFGTRTVATTVALPQDALVGAEFELLEVAGVATTVTALPPAGQTIVGVAVINAAYGHVRVTKVASNLWVGRL